MVKPSRSRKKDFIIFNSKSPIETRALGAKLGRSLHGADLVTLAGDLGSGKTTFVKGLVRALGVRPDRVSSPTFVLVHEYEGKGKVYHMDWYRVRSFKEADRALVSEYLDRPGIKIVEWPERGKRFLPKKRVEVRFFHQGPSHRRIEIRRLGGD